MILSSEITAHQVETVERIIWTLTFAAQLILLVVLVGRDRLRRYPWFTTGIVFSALTLMAEVLLSGRMAMLPLQEILISLGGLSAIVALMVVVEAAWQAFAGAPRAQWIANAAGLLVVSGGVLTVMGPWPAWKKLSLDLPMIKLYLMQFFGRKIELLAALLIIGVGILVAVFGRSFKAGWRSHTQSIVIGLTAVGVSMVAREVVFNRTMHSARSDISVMHLRLGFAFAHEIIYVAALVWWIVWLWRDEPGSAATIKEATPQTSE
jgi:hypothetical protein